VWAVMTLARPTIVRTMVSWDSDRPPNECCQVSHHGHVKQYSDNTLTWRRNTQLLSCVSDALDGIGDVDDPVVLEQAVADLAVAAAPQSMLPLRPLPISTRKPIWRTKGIELWLVDWGQTAATRSLGAVPMVLPAANLGLELPQQPIDVTVLYRNEIRGARTPDLGVCTICGTGPADRVYSPCGHKMVCKKCAQRIMDVPSLRFCSLCWTPVQQCTEVYFREKCVVCLDEQCDTVLLSCGHQCCCYEDASKIWTEKRLCPMCQRRITNFRHQFPIFRHPEKEPCARITGIAG
jgi:hypothetical protein